MSLYGNIAAKKARIKAGSGEKMRKVGAKGAPAKGAFEAAALTAKKPKKGKKVMGISNNEHDDFDQTNKGRRCPMRGSNRRCCNRRCRR
jgi:hypothetical protein